MTKLLSAAEGVLETFVGDIEAVGIEQVKAEWPDLVPTFERALRVLESIHLQKVSPELRDAAVNAAQCESGYRTGGLMKFDDDCPISLESGGAYVGGWMWLDRQTLIDHGWDPDEDL